MKTNFTFLLIFITCTTSNLMAQGWERVYERPEIQFLAGAGFTADGQIQMTGYDRVNDDDDYYLKVDLDGNPVWSFSEDTGTRRILTSMQTQDNATLSGGFIFDSNPKTTYVRKVSANGNELWNNDYLSTDFLRVSDLTETTSGEYYVAGNITGNAPPGDISKVVVIKKLSNSGQEIFTKNFEVVFSNTNGLGSSEVEIETTSDGGALFTFGYQVGSEYGSWFFRMDDQGNEIWRQQYDYATTADIIEMDNGDFVLFGSNFFPGSVYQEAFLQRINSQGNIIWSKDYPKPGYTFSRAMSATLDGNFYLTGFVQDSITNIYAAFLDKIDPQGNQFWSRNYSNSTAPIGLMTADDGGAYIPCQFNGNNVNDYDFYLIKTDTAGVSLSNEISGVVRHDTLKNCLAEANEPGLIGYILELEGGNGKAFANTDSAGHYDFRAGEGDYTLKTFPLSPYYELCDTEYAINFPENNYLTENIDIPIQTLFDCPYLEVSLMTWALRPCFQSSYCVQYCNNGTVVGEDAFVEIIFDDLLMVDSASIAYTENNGIYTFDLGDVEVGECGYFYVYVFLDCDAEVGTTHCTEAHIFPDSLCIPNPNWSGASIEVDAECVDGEIIFNVENSGSASTTVPLNYLVVEDDVILMQGSIDQLSAMDITSLPTITGQGATYRLEVDQEPNHPGDSNPSIAIEGCSDVDPISSGFINVFPQDDRNPFIDIDCMVSTASFDPNDKQGIPLGFSDDHIIFKNQDLEYRLRFQNVGTDTAFNIVIRDTLSSLLDIPSIRPGASSHPYEFKIYGDGIIQFSFKNILLPDSTTNEAGSQGFVKFKIKQQKDLPIGTLIENTAGIFFDFNDPVITNRTRHMIGAFDFPVAIDEPYLESSALHIQPNPFRGESIMTLKNYSIKTPLLLEVYDALGRLQRVERMAQSPFVFPQKNLSPGLYFYQLKDQGKMLTSGKMIIE